MLTAGDGEKGAQEEGYQKEGTQVRVREEEATGRKKNGP